MGHARIPNIMLLAALTKHGPADEIFTEVGFVKVKPLAVLDAEVVVLVPDLERPVFRVVESNEENVFQISLHQKNGDSAHGD